MKLNHSDSLPQTSNTTDHPVILMHGMFGSLSNLGLVGRALLENGYRVIAVDMRNHGLSPHEDTMSYADMAADIIELMDLLDIQKAHLLGHSMGGKVAMQVAMNHPDRVEAIIVADIAPATYSVERHNEILDGLQALTDTEISSRKQADELLARYEPEAGVRGFLLKNLYRQEDGLFGLRLNLEAVISNYCDVLTQAPTGAAFKGKTLFLKGSNSAYIQEKHRNVIDELFPNAKLSIIEGTGHWLHAEKPGLFNQYCLDFFTG